MGIFVALLMGFMIASIGTSTTTPDVPLDGVLMMGGYVDGVSYSDKVSILGSCSFSTTNLPNRVQYAAAARGRDGESYICGGLVYSSGYTKDCYIRDDLTGNHFGGPSLQTPRGSLTLNRVGSKLVAVGGQSSSSQNTYELLDLESDTPTWNQDLSYTISTPRRWHCAVTISSTQVMLIAGVNQNSVETLDITTGGTVMGKPLPVTVYGHQCTIYNSRIWLTGGYTNTYSNKVFSLYLSATYPSSLWILQKPMVYGRAYHVAATINGVLTVYSGISSGYSYKEKLINGAWGSWPLESGEEKRYYSAYVQKEC